jgi:predicted lipoprotein with Yx(FWY)xxD motif
MTNLTKKTLALAATAVLAAGCANWRPYGSEEIRGGMVTDWYNHETVYIFDKDTPNQSNCDAYCTSIWPPYRPAAGESPRGDFTVIKRADGSPQWAYKGMPLYTYTKDTKTGDKNGDGVNGVWRVVVVK